MAEILVSGYYGFNNTGDEAILGGMIRAVRDLAPEVAFTVISGTVAHTRSTHGVAAISRDDIQGIWKAIGRADLMISGGGSLLQDVTSSKSLAYYLGVVTMAKARCKPVMAYAQGIGPVTGPIGKALIPLIMNRVDEISVRDSESGETLRQLGVHRPVHVTADPALALGPADAEAGAALLRSAGVDISRPIIGVSVRPWKKANRPMEPELAAALDIIARETGAQVVFLPMQQPNDVQAAAAVCALMESTAVQVRGNFTYMHLHQMIARCDLMVAMRYHALVFAAMNGVPLVGLSYDPKNDSFLHLIDEQAAGRTEDLEAEAVVAAARRVLTEGQAFRAKLRQRMADLTPLSRQNAELALGLLKRGANR